MKNLLENDFVKYAIALRLKALGFNERCLTYYENEVPKLYHSLSGWDFNNSFLNCISRPTYSQVFDFFRDNYGFYVVIKPFNGGFSCVIWTSKAQNHIGIYNSYKEAELACIDRLIEITRK